VPIGDTSSAREAALALGLGWSAAEMVGRYRHGIHPRNPAACKSWEGRNIPRLSYSSRTLSSNNDLFWLAAQRLIVLADKLGLDDLEGKGKAGSIDTRIRGLPGEIRKYIADPTSTSALEPESFYRLLEDWTQLARLELGVRSQALREAFSFSGDLADLYWALPVPQRHNLPRWAASWRKMLYKIPRVIAGLERVEPSLPPYAFAAIKNSLEKWQKAHPSWLRDADFTLEQARRLSEKLGEQARIWGDILKGERLPEDYLQPNDRLWIGVLVTIAFITILSLILLAFSVMAVGAFQAILWVVVPFLRSFFPGLPPSAFMTTPSLGEWLALGSIMATAVGFLVSTGVWFFRQLGSIYRWLRDVFTPSFVCRRTLVPWEQKHTDKGRKR